MHMHVNLSIPPRFDRHTIVSSEGSVLVTHHHNLNFSASYPKTGRLKQKGARV